MAELSMVARMESMGNLDHVRFQLEQIEKEQLQAAMDAFKSKREGNPLEALVEIGRAAGLAYALGRAWYGCGDGTRSTEFHDRAAHFNGRADELIETLSKQSE